MMNGINYFSDLHIANASRILILEPGRDFMSASSGSFEFIRKGSTTLEYGGRKLFLESPVLTWILPDTPLRFSNESGDLYDHLWINFSGPRAWRILDSFRQSIPAGMIRLDAERCRMLEIAFMSIINDFRTDAERYQDRMVFTLEKMIWDLQNYLVPLPVKTASDPYGFHELAQNIALNPFDPADFQHAAEERGITFLHFRRLFRQVTGVPLHQYVLQQKIRYCTELLRSGRFQIKEIA